MTRRILLLGCVGQLGWEAQRALSTLGELVCRDYPQVDFAHPETLPALLAEVRPQVILNAVAYTAVDRAENEPALARAINATAPGVLAEPARQQRAALIHISTDYVFDGSQNSPYREDDPPHPINTYGQTKLEGEQLVAQAGGAAVTLRTSWVYTLRRDSFATKVLEWSRKQPVLKVVTDQVGSPTWARLLAEITAQLVAAAGDQSYDWFSQHAGLYHLAGEGACSRFEFARAVLDNDPKKHEQVTERMEPALTADFPTPAARPLYSALDCSRFAAEFNLRLPPWQAALRLAMED